MKKKCLILIADDDEDYFLVVKHALSRTETGHELKWVEDGEALLDYLCRNKKDTAASTCPRPDLILMDINMPKKTGLEILREIRSTPEICAIPIIILTASDDPKDIEESYRFGANSFITKPAYFNELNETVKLMVRYWLESVRLPAAVGVRSADTED